MSLTRKRKPSPKQVEANRRNGRKSNGPCTPHGKLHVALNALRHGLHAQPMVKAMLAVGEEPCAYYRVLAQLFASLRPADPHQRMQVEDTKQRALRRYQFDNREYAEITSDQRDACYAPSDDALARVGPWPRMAMPQAKMKDQSRQVIETKGSASENKAVDWGRRSHFHPEAAGPSGARSGHGQDGHATGKNEGSKPSTY